MTKHTIEFGLTWPQSDDPHRPLLLAPQDIEHDLVAGLLLLDVQVIVRCPGSRKGRWSEVGVGLGDVG
jgi:hypothetical protein